MKSYLCQVHWTFCEFLILTRRRQQYSFSMKKLHDFVRAVLSGSWFARSRVAPAFLLQFQRCSLLPVLPPLVLPSWSFSGPWLPTFLSLIVIALCCVVVDSGADGFFGASWSDRPAAWVCLDLFWSLESWVIAFGAFPCLDCHCSAYYGFSGPCWSGRSKPAAWVLPECKACEGRRGQRLVDVVRWFTTIIIFWIWSY